MTEYRDSNSRMAFARRLRALRAAHGAAEGFNNYPPKNFAAALGIEEARYRRWERGEMEPSLGHLVNIQRVTGVSLDMLLAGRDPSRRTSIPRSGLQEGEFTAGERLRMACEAREPDYRAVADVMGVSHEEWLSWESGAIHPPLGEMEEFCLRWGLSLDYIYRGMMHGVSHDLGLFLTKTVAGHRSAAGARVRGSRKAVDGDTNSQVSNPTGPAGAAEPIAEPAVVSFPPKKVQQKQSRMPN